MQRVFIVALLMLTATAKDHQKTLGELFIGLHGMPIQDWYYYVLLKDTKSVSLPLDKEVKETLEYIPYLTVATVLLFSEAVGNVPLQSIYDDLNGNCSDYLETRILDLTVRTKDSTCINLWLSSALQSKLKYAITVAWKQLSDQCGNGELNFCTTHGNCIVPYGEHLAREMISIVPDVYDARPETFEPPLVVIDHFMLKSTELLRLSSTATFNFLSSLAYVTFKTPAIEPFAFENLVNPGTNKVVSVVIIKEGNTSASHDDFSWGVVRSYSGTIEHPCLTFRHTYMRNSNEFQDYLIDCFSLQMLPFNVDFMRCVYNVPATEPLAWKADPPVYFHSQCLCVAFSGKECGIKAPQGVDPSDYCLSVLLTDFQKRVWHRPAVTYLDYAIQTPVPVCKFSDLLSVTFKEICQPIDEKTDFSATVFTKCYFKDLVSRQLECNGSQPVTTYNRSELCAAKRFMRYVLCGDVDTDVEFRVPFYGPGNSAAVLALTCVDATLRFLALVTYLSCPELRNLPGKLLIGYQLTALLRLFLVRASLEDFPLAVRLDVALDLGSTLWLTSYLHFLTSSIKTLRAPDSLSTVEARMVLLRYALLGWAAPSTLCAAFFWMDETLDSRVMIGQLLFVLCNYVALLGNLIMFLYNFNFYYDVKKDTLGIKVGVSARSIFADLFNFALKTSILSGVGIVFRLIFSQIQGLEHLLSYYHALGTLHSILIFLLYGCNLEARAFWISVFSRTLSRCRRNQSTPLQMEGGIRNTAV